MLTARHLHVMRGYSIGHRPALNTCLPPPPNFIYPLAFTVVYQMIPPGLAGKLGLIFSVVGALVVTASLDITTCQAAAPRPYNVPLFP